MQYKYFTEKLFTQGGLDLTNVFVDKDRIVKQQSNVDYGFPQIVEYLKLKSKNFTIADRTLMDFDYAIKEIVSRWYKSIGQDNPFVTDEDKVELDKYQQGIKPRDAVTTENGKIKKLGASSTKATEPTKGGNKKSEKVEDFSKEQIIDSIDGLRLLAEMGDEDAQATIDGLELLLD